MPQPFLLMQFNINKLQLQNLLYRRNTITVNISFYNHVNPEILLNEKLISGRTELKKMHFITKFLLFELCLFEFKYPEGCQL